MFRCNEVVVEDLEFVVHGTGTEVVMTTADVVPEGPAVRVEPMDGECDLVWCDRVREVGLGSGSGGGDWKLE
jgi:hypothetical protein